MLDLTLIVGLERMKDGGGGSENCHNLGRLRHKVQSLKEFHVGETVFFLSPLPPNQPLVRKKGLGVGVGVSGYLGF